MPDFTLGVSQDITSDGYAIVRAAGINSQWDGYTATTATFGNGLSWGSSGGPNIWRRGIQTNAGHANRIYASSGALSASQVYSKDIYIGATARIFRVANGVMSQVRESEITGAAIAAWQPVGASGVVFGTPSVIVDPSVTTFSFLFNGFNRPGVAYWFRVAAVDGTTICNWTSAVSYTPSNVTATASVSNTMATLTTTGEGGGLAAPANFTVTAGSPDRIAVLAWDAVSGAEGYVVQVAFEDPATNIVASPYLEMASDPTAILSGDLVIIERRLTTADPNYLTSRVYLARDANSIIPSNCMGRSDGMKADGNDWEFVAFSGSQPSGVTADYFFRRTAAAGQTASLEKVFHSGSAQSFYDVLSTSKTYKWRAYMRASSATTATLNFTASYVTDTTFSVTTSWQLFEYTFTPSSNDTGSTAYSWQLSVTAGGSSLDLDVVGLQVFDTEHPFHSLVNNLPATGGLVRDHNLIKLAARTVDIASIAGLPGDSIRSGWTLGSLYQQCTESSGDPWLQIEWHLPQSDWLNLAAFLAAANGAHAMATKRAAAGMTDPWTTTFDRIVLEMGNEAWQSGSISALNENGEFWNFPSSMTDSATAEVYTRGEIAGMYWQMVWDWIKASPYWSTLNGKLVPHLGGWARNSFTEEAYSKFLDATEVSIAAYNQGWDNGAPVVSETGLSFQSILADPMTIQRDDTNARVAGLQAACTAASKTYGTDVRLTIYEAGPGYILDGLNGETVTDAQAIVQEVVMKSRACGTSTLDSALDHAASNFIGYNFFTLGSGDTWTAYAPDAQGGGEYISHALLRIVHENICPATLTQVAAVKGDTTTITFEDASTADIDGIGVYHLQSNATPTKHVLVIVNRNIDPSLLDLADPDYSATPSGTKSITIKTNWTGAHSLTVWDAGIGNFRHHNRYPVGERLNTSGTYDADALCVAFDYTSKSKTVPADLTNIVIDDAVGATSSGLPAGNCLIMLFEGVAT